MPGAVPVLSPGVPSLDLDAHAERLASHLTVLRPEGPGPFPVVVQMHGCGGVLPLQMRYAEVARATGYAAVIVDSLKPRGIGRLAAQLTVCTGLRLRGAERAVDLLAILHWLRRQSWADADRVVAAGWSHGGWTIMDAMAGAGPKTADDLLGAVKAVAVFYPYAGVPALTIGSGWGERRPKVFGCIAGQDRVVGRVLPARALDRLERDGLAVTRLVLAEATHCFDEEGSTDPRVRYRPDLEAQAHRFYAEALRASLLPSGEKEIL